MTQVKRYLGLREETEFDETIGTVDYYVDAESVSLDTMQGKHIIFEGGLGKRVHKKGYTNTSGQIVTPVQISVLSDLMKWCLGGEIDLNTYYDSRDNIIPSFQAMVGKDVFRHDFRGCVIDTLTLEANDEFLKTTIDVVGATSEKSTIESIEDLTFKSDNLLAFYDICMTKDGVDFNGIVKNLTITISNNASVDNGKTICKQTPSRIPVSNRNIEISADLWFEDSTQFDDYESGTDSEYVFTISDGSEDLVITIPVGFYNGMTTQWSTRDELVQSATIQAMYGTVTKDVNDYDTQMMVEYNTI